MRSTSKVIQKNTVVGVSVNQIRRLVRAFTPKHTAPVDMDGDFQVLFTIADGEVSCEVNPRTAGAVQQPRAELSGMLKNQLVDILAVK